MGSTTSRPQPLWTPKQADTTRLAAFAANHLQAGAGYPDIHAFSVQQPAAFWDAVWDDCGIIGDKGGTVLKENGDMRSARFFPEARLNFAENLLTDAVTAAEKTGDESAPAIMAWGESRAMRHVSHAALKQQAIAFAVWLKAQGVRPGDRVAAVMPNIPETVIAMLGASAIGAVFSSTSPDFGEQGILDRFGQIEPVILVAADGYFYNGKTIDCRDKIANVAAALPGLRRLVRVNYADLPPLTPTENRVNNLIENWDEIIAPPANAETEAFIFERFAFNHPLYILYSSGTTGKPKCIIHGAGGTLIQHKKEHQLQLDLRAGDRMFYFTTCGWMMWNWLVSALASRVTLMLFDGAPLYPDATALLQVIADEKANFFGVSAKYIDALKKQNLDIAGQFDLSALKTITSTGSPLSPEGFDYIYQSVKQDVHLASICGGTDIVSCFVGGNPLGAVYGGEIQAAGLGMAIEIWDDNGAPVTGERGELVCRQPFPSMPVGFWDDPSGAKYRAAYFDRYPGIWCQGDFAIHTEQDGFIVLGRSDATLNPGGVRIGTAEIYRQTEPFDEIAEAAVIGQNWQDDVRVVLFVVLQDGVDLSAELTSAIKQKIRQGASPRHVPAAIIAVPDIPRTKSGKISELAIRDIIHGQALNNTEALANPEALEIYRQLAQDLAATT